jgi:hypothetical protein
MPVGVNRRDFIVTLGGALVLPSATGAQGTDRIRRIGVLMTGPADDVEGQSRLAGFLRVAGTRMDRWQQPADRLPLG